MGTAIDHIVVAAETLEQGAAYVKKMLGVDIPFGGEHPKMGTHNLLMQLGDAQFLEVIAINPNAPTPSVPRWFGLDDPHVRHRLSSGPTLLTWVVNTPDIKSLLQKVRFPFGQPEHISRGDLNWIFGLPEDGRLMAGGMLPYLMQWQTGHHPAAAMENKCCALESVTLYHPNSTWLKSVLESIDLNHQVKVKSLAGNATPYLLVSIRAPNGVKELRSF